MSKACVLLCLGQNNFRPLWAPQRFKSTSQNGSLCTHVSEGENTKVEQSRRFLTSLCHSRGILVNLVTCGISGQQNSKILNLIKNGSFDMLFLRRYFDQNELKVLIPTTILYMHQFPPKKVDHNLVVSAKYYQLTLLTFLMIYDF